MPEVSDNTAAALPTDDDVTAAAALPTDDDVTAAAALPTDDDVMGVLRGVIDPELGSDIVELGMARGAVVNPDGLVEVTVALTTSGCPLRAQIQRDVQRRVGGLPGVEKVKIHWSELTQAEKAAAMSKARFNVSQNAPDTAVPPTAKVVMVASGKGGVGKSTVTVNLAAELARRGMRVGVMDADIWGYSVPRMLGVEGRLAGAETEKKIIPNERPVGDGALEVVSMGFLVDKEETALMWRGLILNRAVQHFLQDVRWGQVDYLLIDMPPGTGDVQMGIAKMLPQAEMVVVTTPARNAQKVATRVASMGRSNYLRIAGVIENMSVFLDPEGRSHAIFGAGGGQELADQLGVPLMGQVPIDGSVATGGDMGTPVVLENESGPAADAFRAITDRLQQEVPPVDMASCTARIFEAAEQALANLDTVSD